MLLNPIKILVKSHKTPIFLGQLWLIHHFPIVSPRFSTGSSTPGRPGSGLERAERADSRKRGVQWSLVLFTKFGDAMVNKQKAIENGLWLSTYWEFHHPNWRTHIFQRGWNHQPDSQGYEPGQITVDLNPSSAGQPLARPNTCLGIRWQRWWIRPVAVADEKMLVPSRCVTHVPSLTCIITHI